jgi:hypothetical protein
MKKSKTIQLLGIHIIVSFSLLLKHSKRKPNIVIIWGERMLGNQTSVAYSMGMMGYKTPNITA